MESLPVDNIAALDDHITSDPESTWKGRTRKPLSTLRRNIKFPGPSLTSCFRPAKFRVPPNRTAFMDWQIDSDLEKLVKAEMEKPKNRPRPRFTKYKSERLRRSETSKADLKHTLAKVLKLPADTGSLSAERIVSTHCNTEMCEMPIQNERVQDHLGLINVPSSARSISDDALSKQLRGVTALLPPSERAFGAEVFEQFKQVSAPSRKILGSKNAQNSAPT